MLLRVQCVRFLWCKLDLNDLARRGFPPSESAQNARPDPTHASDCARGDIARIWTGPRNQQFEQRPHLWTNPTATAASQKLQTLSYSVVRIVKSI